MPIDSKVRIFLELSKSSSNESIRQSDIELYRNVMNKKFSHNRIKFDDVLSTDCQITTTNGPITIRHYHNKNSNNQKNSGLIYYHGGGGSIFSIDVYDSVCRYLCHTSSAEIISIGYHLAPEYKFPVQYYDAIEAYKWIIANHDSLCLNPTKVAVAGDSFGGYLATEVCMFCRDNYFILPSKQFLIYPRTDHNMPGSSSLIDYSSGYSLDSDLMNWYWDNYLPPNPDFNDPRLCPNRAHNFSNYPPSRIFTAEFDPLRDEGEIYAYNLLNAGCDVELYRIDGYIHGFILLWEYLDKSKKVLDMISQSI